MHLKKVVPLGIIFAVIGIALFYVLMSVRYQNVFLPHTVYSGVNIAGKTPEQANQKLKAHIKKQHYQLVEGKKDILQFTGKDLNIDHDYAKQLTAIKNQQNPWSWSLKVFAAPSETGVKAENLALNQQKVDQLYQQVVKATATDRVQTKDATLSKDNGSFTIKKEVYGNNIDEQQLKKQIVAAVDQGQTKINIKKAYVQPNVTSDDKQLQSDKQKLNAILNENITYKIAGNDAKIPKTEIDNWLNYTDGKIALDQTSMARYIASLSAKYGTINKTRDFKTEQGQTVQVPAGTYGWSIKSISEAKALATEMLKGEDFTRKPLIQGVGYNENGDDIGNTYVEVSKSAQHMWVHKDGKVIISTDVVTGKPGQDTPSGTFVVWNKVRNTQLKGKNDDGSDYSSPVSYWMPVDYTGVGLHDSPWQPTYGGDWYKAHGSHGCVNTPPSVMAQVFADVPLNTPVIIY
ncbi:L,D-transpeptidase/peptidoglycan binding protein [Lactobacillus sp. CC-MHH1034]|uniref:L,D-transpeptidase family protein n=1 Tax=Agrilactobacillus fermenti TaxID=2586909 RepID=UPI001E565DF2|nr:L,D-transpeptidase family protein [Agrilactobacillus fermenti]MCD2255952.1 L,D-transpeptidase/peptidoglycan binding protein [Agrilactobacillus fermenti]